MQPQSPDSPYASPSTLIETNAGVARSMASRYRNRGIDLDDLEQVALLGLTKAAQRFDPDAGHDFLSYAVPTIRGELRRHFRDAGWMVRPPRRVQDLQARISRAQDELEAALGRSPRPSEVAAHLGVGARRRRRGADAPTAASPRPRSTAPVGDGSSIARATCSACDDRAVAAAEARIVLEPVVRTLSERDRRILHLRFVEERTQQEIAEEVGLTQAQVSRVLTADPGRPPGRPARRRRRLTPGRPDDPAARRAQESKPSPAASSARRKALRRPSRWSARSSDQRVRLIPTDASGSGGNGSGRSRTIRSAVRSVGSPASRSSSTSAAKRVAPTPSPVNPVGVGHPAAVGEPVERGELGAGVDRARPAVA